MLSIKLHRYFYYFLFSVPIMVSCEEKETYKSNSTFTEDKNVSFVSQVVTDKVKTNTILSGTWESFDSGSKSKWIFNEEGLQKSNIYSFGEAGNPQKYNLQIVEACNGKANEYGEYVLMSLANDGEGHAMCYQLVSYTDKKVKLQSKHGHSITLSK